MGEGLPVLETGHGFSSWMRIYERSLAAAQYAEGPEKDISVDLTKVSSTKEIWVPPVPREVLGEYMNRAKAEKNRVAKDEEMAMELREYAVYLEILQTEGIILSPREEDYIEEYYSIVNNTPSYTLFIIIGEGNAVYELSMYDDPVEGSRENKYTLSLDDLRLLLYKLYFYQVLSPPG